MPFPANRYCILQYEACRADPAAELARTFAFIGLPATTVDPGRLTRAGEPHHGPQGRPLAQPARGPLDGYAPDLERLPALAPELDLTLWPSAREGLGT